MAFAVFKWIWCKIHTEDYTCITYDSCSNLWHCDWKKQLQSLQHRHQLEVTFIKHHSWYYATLQHHITQYIRHYYITYTLRNIFIALRIHDIICMSHDVAIHLAHLTAHNHLHHIFINAHKSMPSCISHTIYSSYHISITSWEYYST